MKRQRQSTKGFALITVISLMAILVIYLAAVQGQVLITSHHNRIEARRVNQAMTVATLLAKFGAADHQDVAWTSPDGLGVRVSSGSLLPGNPIWGKVIGLEPLPGDRLVTMRWVKDSVGPASTQYVINTEGRRVGAISLGATALSGP
jgi:hypothetical protein